MVKETINGQTFYLDGFYKTSLEKVKAMVRRDYDFIALVDGSEGAGKSVFTMQGAFYVDPSLTLDRVTFSAKEFRKAVIHAEPYQSVIYDEAYTGLMSRATMSLVNKTLVSMLAEIRQKNLIVWVVMPTFFDLDKYVALWRSRFLVHVYTDDEMNRGYFSFWDAGKKKKLYLSNKKEYIYDDRFNTPNFRGRYTNTYVLDEKAYRKKKLDSLKGREQEREQVEQEKEVQLILFAKVQKQRETLGLSHEQAAKLLELPIATYYWQLKRFKEVENLV